MSDKQIGTYPLNIKIVSGSYDIANIDINVPIHVDPNERVKYEYDGGVTVHAKVPDEFKDKMRKALVDAVMSLEKSLNEETEVIAHEKSSMA